MEIHSEGAPVVDEIRPTSWSELQECLYEHAWNPVLRRYRSNLAFRGEPDASFDLRSSLVRLGDEAAEQMEATCCATSASTRTATPCPATRSGTGSPWPSTTGCPLACSTGPIRPTWRCTSPPRTSTST